MSDENPLINIIEPDCPMGYTKVCTVALPEESMKMAQFCPKAITTESTGDEQEQKCSCLQTLVVEQAVEDGISPLGKKHKQCVYVDYDLVFPTVNGLFSIIEFICFLH